LGNSILFESVGLIEERFKLDGLVVERAVLGLFFTGVKLNNGSGGLCATPVKEIPEAVCCPSSLKVMPLSGSLRGRPAHEYLDDLSSTNILKKTLGIAVLNALSAEYWLNGETDDYELSIGADAFDEISIDITKKTVVVGALVPLLKKLIAAKAPFTVLEKDPATLKPYEMPFYLSADRAAEVVPAADILVITGTTLLNGTLPGLLEMAKHGAEIVVAGPTASMLPDAFFRRGVTVLGGVLVTKADEALDVISEGGSGYHFFNKSAERLVVRRKQGAN
jgi:uncharacterized protein (DUF4213/DUF364 family)